MRVGDRLEDPRKKNSIYQEDLDVYIKAILPARIYFVCRGAAGLEKDPQWHSRPQFQMAAL